MLTYDRSPGATTQRTEEECWAAFWQVVGAEAYRIWLSEQAEEGETTD